MFVFSESGQMPPPFSYSGRHTVGRVGRWRDEEGYLEPPGAVLLFLSHATPLKLSDCSSTAADGVVSYTR